MENIREIVLDTLLEIEKEQVFGSALIGQVLSKYDYFSGQDKSFLKRLAEGTIEKQITLDYVIDAYSKVPVKKMKPLIRNLMRMSVYQILYMDAIPDSAACNEAVKLAQKRKFGQLKGFVNGVLRTVSRNKAEIPWPKEEDKDWRYALSVKNSMPQIILSLWEKDYGREMTEKLAYAQEKISPVSIRVEENLSAAQKEKLLNSWDKAGIQYEVHPYLPYAYRCSKVEGVNHLPGFAEGWITVQDVSSMFVAHLAGIKQGDFVLDVCAAPGGKSLHAAAKLQGTGQVCSRDVSDTKIQLIEDNIARMGYQNMKTTVWDAREIDHTMIEKADVLFLDVPCSGLGIISKKSDIKYHVTKESLEEIGKLQKQIIESSIGYVKPGGTVMFSTCTIRKEENQNMAVWMADTFGLAPVSLDDDLPEELRNQETKNGMLQLFPGVHECDGFFIAKFRKE